MVEGKAVTTSRQKIPVTKEPGRLNTKTLFGRLRLYAYDRSPSDDLVWSDLSRPPYTYPVTPGECVTRIDLK